MKNSSHNAEVCFFPLGHAGKEKAFRANSARIGIVFPLDETDMHYSAIITSKKDESLSLGRILDVTIEFMNDVDTVKKFDESETFELYDGARRIGIGRKSVQPKIV